jgi:hypothetical protein
MNPIEATRAAVLTRLNIDHLAPTGDLARITSAGALIVDPTRVRPRYFDGRFLAARDLQRDQTYFLTRQRELTQSADAGVVSGLMVASTGQTTLSITPGSGITPSGDLVVIGDQDTTTTALDPLIVDLADVPTIQRLDAAFGLLATPAEPARNRTGLFVLALRPVEYTANPRGAYPASIAERRVPEDGDIIEATAVTLVPLHADTDELPPAQQRAAIAREIFLLGTPQPVPEEALPIALVQLAAGTVTWVDPFLVRREIGAEHAGVAGVGLSVARAVCEAYLLQYQAQLADVMVARAAGGQPAAFVATDSFRALPPAGPLPAAAAGSAGAVPTFFPPQVQVTTAAIPVDEIAALVDEALLLPPIDLTLPPEQLATLAVLIAQPTPRGTAAGSGGAPPALSWFLRQRTLHVVPDAVAVPDVGQRL